MEEQNTELPKIRKIENDIADELYLFSKENPKGDPVLNLRNKMNEVIHIVNKISDRINAL